MALQNHPEVEIIEINHYGRHVYFWITWQVSIPPARKPAHIICAVTDPEYDDALLQVALEIISTSAWEIT